MNQLQFFEACKNDDFDAVQKCLNKGFLARLFSPSVDINAKNRDGNPPLMLTHNVEIINLLIDKGAYIHANREYRENMLYRAAKVYNSFPELFQILIERGLDINAVKQGRTMLIHAASLRDTTIAKAFIDNGADLNTVYERDEKLDLLEPEWQGGVTALITSIIQSYGRSIEIAKLLINAGADVNKATDFGYTPLMISFSYLSDGSTKDVIRLLIDKGADINKARRSGHTVLFDAIDNYEIERKYFDLFKLLINKGADVNSATENGVTPLMWASGRNHINTVKLLISEGADVNATNICGETALFYAKNSRYDDPEEIVKLLNKLNVKSVISDSFAEKIDKAIYYCNCALSKKTTATESNLILKAKKDLSKNNISNAYKILMRMGPVTADRDLTISQYIADACGILEDIFDKKKGKVKEGTYLYP